MFAPKPFFASIHRALAVLLILCAAALPFSAGAQDIDRDTHITAELLAAGPAIPGKQLMLALHFVPGPGWHGYWINPGDAGYGMKLDWQLPAGWTAGKPLYPVPHQLRINGLMNHVYEGPYAVLIPVQIPPSATIRGSLPVAVDANWLACTDVICVPEHARLSMRLPIAAITADSNKFAEWRGAIPALLDQTGRFAVTEKLLRIAVPIPSALQLPSPHIFLENADLVSYSKPQSFTRSGDRLIAEIPLQIYGGVPRRISGILAFNNSKGVRFTAVAGTVPPAGTALADGDANTPPMWGLFIGALLGGLLLNIMPCVFPILSLKAISLARAGESEAQARAEALAYTGGVVAACLALGGALLALRGAGEEVGWAFQLQQPAVVAALLGLMVLITANLAGLFELPALSITRSGEPTSAFVTGLLTAVIATPCTGPFMAAALGAALLLPTGQAMVLFGTLGMGLALPFLLIGFVPGVRRILPRPGAWMQTFRRFMAVPMGLTALALVWLCWRMGGAGFAAGTLVAAVLVLIAIIALSGDRIRLPLSSPVLATLLVMAATLLSVAIARNYTPRQHQIEAGVLGAVPFSEAALAEARARGKPVFVWFTADWCLTCKVNEGVAIETELTGAAFRKAGVVAMKGDWTRQDNEITRFLNAQGVAGIPLYLWYPPRGRGQRLGQVLGPNELANLAGKIKPTAAEP